VAGFGPLVKTVNALSAAGQIARVLFEQGKRFVFLAGAGVSHPAVPLSFEIEARCREEITRLGLEQPPLGKRPAARYQECMAVAFPNSAQRRDFLAGLIVGTEPSAANRQLAALLGLEGLGRVVLTPNFDDHLTRALSAQGNPAAVCDHPATAYRVGLEISDEPVIVQVHGTYQHYDSCNLSGEIRKRGRARGMRVLVERILHQLSPIVLGYAGWPEDVLMRALRERLEQGALPFNLYWHAFRVSDVAVLPRWLTHHESVRIVLPDSSAGRDTLPAEEVLEHFARQIATRVAPIAPATLNRLINRPKLEAGSLRSMETAHETFDPKKLSEDDLLRAWERERYWPALKARAHAGSRSILLGDEEPSPPNFYYCDALLEDLYLRTWETAPSLALETCQLRWDLTRAAAERFAVDRLTWQTRQAAALHGKALSLRGLDRREDSLAVFHELRLFLRGRTESEMQLRAARALVAEGVTLFEIGRYAEAHACWENVSQSAASVFDAPGLGDEMARALFNCGLARWKTGYIAAALLAWNELAGMVMRDSDRATPAALSLVDRAWLLLARLRHDPEHVHPFVSSDAGADARRWPAASGLVREAGMAPARRLAHAFWEKVAQRARLLAAPELGGLARDWNRASRGSRTGGGEAAVFGRVAADVLNEFLERVVGCDAAEECTRRYRFAADLPAAEASWLAAEADAQRAATDPPAGQAARPAGVAPAHRLAHAFWEEVAQRVWLLAAPGLRGEIAGDRNRAWPGSRADGGEAVVFGRVAADALSEFLEQVVGRVAAADGARRYRRHLFADDLPAAEASRQKRFRSWRPAALAA
jgi:hypothetical protein